jgi:dTDP-4-amino-4,6-dideoxygalactose transaminase
LPAGGRSGATKNAARVGRRAGLAYHGGRAASPVPGLYDVIGVGMNYRMSEMQAALGLSQLRRLPEALERRAENFRALKEGIAATGLAHVLDTGAPAAESAHYCLTAVLGEGARRTRNEVALALKQRGIGTSIYYPQPVPRLAYYRGKYGYDAAMFPGAEAVSDRGIALPVGPHLSVADMKTIADEFARAAGG